MKKISYLFSFLLVCLSIPYAAQAEAMKVGVVDFQAILAKSTKATQMRKQLEAKFKPRQEKLLMLQSSIKADMEKLQRDATVMSAGQKQGLEDKIVKAKREFERKGRDYQQDLNTQQGRSMKVLVDDVKSLINKVAKAEHYDLVLQKGGVPYFDAKIDLTSKVIKAL